MPDLNSDYVDLVSLKESLTRGDQRKLAKRLGCDPSKITNAFDGFVRDPEFLGKLVAETRKLIQENETVTS